MTQKEFEERTGKGLSIILLPIITSMAGRKIIWIGLQAITLNIK